MDDEICPWDTAPKTLEDLVASSAAQAKWEADNGRSAPYAWNIIVTRQMFTQIINRLILLENEVYRD